MNTEEKEESLETASDIMTDVTEQEPDDEKQKEAYEEYLYMDDEKSDELSRIEQAPSVNDDFENLDDAELEATYDEALEIPEEERSEYQNFLLEQTKERYLRMKFYRQFEDAARWYEGEYDGKSFSEIVTDSAFLDYASGVKLPIRALVRRFTEMKEKGKSTPAVQGPGSAVNYGATVGKDYFSRAEVEKMSEADIEKNLETIKKSMTKWK